jgi:hypothetical protein
MFPACDVKHDNEPSAWCQQPRSRRGPLESGGCPRHRSQGNIRFTRVRGLPASPKSRIHSIQSSRNSPASLESFKSRDSVTSPASLESRASVASLESLESRDSPESLESPGSSASPASAPGLGRSPSERSAAAKLAATLPRSRARDSFVCSRRLCAQSSARGNSPPGVATSAQHANASPPPMSLNALTPTDWNASAPRVRCSRCEFAPSSLGRGPSADVGSSEARSPTSATPSASMRPLSIRCASALVRASLGACNPRSGVATSAQHAKASPPLSARTRSSPPVGLRPNRGRTARKRPPAAQQSARDLRPSGTRPNPSAHPAIPSSQQPHSKRSTPTHPQPQRPATLLPPPEPHHPPPQSLSQGRSSPNAPPP